MKIEATQQLLQAQNRLPQADVFSSVQRASFTAQQSQQDSHGQQGQQDQPTSPTCPSSRTRNRRSHRPPISANPWPSTAT